MQIPTYNEKEFMETTERLQLNDACKRQHQAVIDKGFTNFEVPNLLMLIVSELAEALEADRNNRHADYDAFYKEYKQRSKECGDNSEFNRILYKEHFEKMCKNTFEDEIADAFLRLMDLVGAYGIDIERAIHFKQNYNLLRPIKHGKAY